MIKVLVFPHDDTNPYPTMLYGSMPPDEVQTAYFPMPTWSQTLNLLLIPFTLARYRARGYRIWHIHFSYLFNLVWSFLPGARRLLQAWYGICLGAGRLLGYRIVWTAHNLVPLATIFADDEAARRRLVGAASAVIAHNKWSIDEIRRFGDVPVEHIPFGPYHLFGDRPSRAEARRHLGLDPSARLVLFFGAVADYKGVDVLLEAMAQVPEDVGLQLVVVGACGKPAMQRRVHSLASRDPGRITVRLGRLPDDELARYLSAADVAVLPFRRITNSSSLLLALDVGLPVIIPDLATLDEIGEGPAFRYAPGDRASLARTLVQAATIDGAALEAMSQEARACVADLSWERTALDTVALYRSVLEPRT